MDDINEGCARKLPHLSSYFDMTTFQGRLRYHWMLCNPLGLRWGKTAVQQALTTVHKWQEGGLVLKDELVHAQTVLVVNAPQDHSCHHRVAHLAGPYLQCL